MNKFDELLQKVEVIKSLNILDNQHLSVAIDSYRIGRGGISLHATADFFIQNINPEEVDFIGFKGGDDYPFEFSLKKEKFEVYALLSEKQTVKLREYIEKTNKKLDEKEAELLEKIMHSSIS